MAETCGDWYKLANRYIPTPFEELVLRRTISEAKKAMKSPCFNCTKKERRRNNYCPRP